MYGEPALPPDFAHLPQANPEAPKGGRLVISETGTFDSLNPFILKGNAPWALRFLVFESLLGRNWDEPFALYGLLAESVETDDDRSYVAFTLREEARFADGSPVTVEDVIWSFETLAARGLPGFATTARGITAITRTGPRSLRIDFAGADRELPLILGLRPILKKADWEGVDFADSSLRVPVGSGAYVVDRLEPGRFVTFRRNPDWWARDLPLMRGQMNFDEIRIEYFRDGTAAFEAFRAGEVMVWREGDPDRLATAYDFPAMRDGRMTLATIPHGRPTGMRGFVFNTRRPLFEDWRVREALITAFNFPWISQRLNGGALPRIPSYFGNTDLAATGPASPQEAALLAPFLDDLPPGVLEGYRLPPGDAAARDRAGLRRARALLEEAGWTVRDGRLRNAAGAPFGFEILLRPIDSEALAALWADALAGLGIEAQVRIVDAAQYNLRRDAYDFDVIVNAWALSLSPGNEQWLYWGSDGRTSPGTRNYMGAAEPAIDAMIRAMLAARSRADFTAAVRALDRVLMAGRYVVPFWHNPQSWIAHDARLAYPARLPLYGDWIGFLPDLWWWKG